MCRKHTLRAKHTVCGNLTLSIETNLVRIEITLVRVVITFLRVIITLMRVKTTLCVLNHTLRVEITLCVWKSHSACGNHTRV
jgi:hypothetical protein